MTGCGRVELRRGGVFVLCTQGGLAPLAIKAHCMLAYDGLLVSSCQSEPGLCPTLSGPKPTAEHKMMQHSHDLKAFIGSTQSHV